MSAGQSPDDSIPSHFKYIRDIVKGDRVLQPDGSEATVLCVVRWTSKLNYVTLSSLPPVQGFGGLRVTRYHPYLDEESSNFPEWKLPADVAPTPCYMIYNLVLSRGHQVVADGRASVTIGHQLEPCRSFYSHSFWGSQQALDDLACHPYFWCGSITFGEADGVVHRTFETAPTLKEPL